MSTIAKFWISAETGDVVRLRQFGVRFGTSESSTSTSWRRAADRLWDDEWRPVEGREDWSHLGEGDIEWLEVWGRLDDPPGPRQMRLLRKRGEAFEVCTSFEDVEGTFGSRDAATRRLAELELTLITRANNTVAG